MTLQLELNYASNRYWFFGLLIWPDFFAQHRSNRWNFSSWFLLVWVHCFLAQIFSGLVSLEIIFWKFASIIPTPIKNYRSVRFRSTLTLKHVISLWFIQVFELDQIWHEIDFLPEASFPDRFWITNQLNHSDQLWYNQFESSHCRFLSWISTVNHKTKNWWINTAFFFFVFLRFNNCCYFFLSKNNFFNCFRRLAETIVIN